ncbi:MULTISPECIES: hypothetical protein [Gluconobacter]|uniref:hypothetical protein n=1 Tax=Gluconobacter TaxID=441 RepID=UPI0027D2F775|nr:hypothetical protein [Gluconobacter sp. P5E10]
MTHGVLSVRCKAQHRSQITLKKNPELPILRNEFDPRDQRTNRFSGLRPGGLVLQAGVKRRDLLAIQLRHVGMQQRRRGRGFRQSFLYLGLAGFKVTDAVFEA